MSRRFVLAGMVAISLAAVAGSAAAGAVRYPISYDTVLSGLDPAMSCSQVDKAIHWVKLDMSLMQTGQATFGRDNGRPEIYNTDTQNPHSGDNREVITRDGSNDGGLYGDTNHHGDAGSDLSRGGRHQDNSYANARADYIYLRGLLSTCTDNRS